MAKDYAMDYESIIRRTYKCGRNSEIGANSDIFRGLEKTEAFLMSEKDKISKGIQSQDDKTIDVFAFEYGTKAGEVATYLSLAIVKILAENNELLSNDQKSTLNNCKQTLFYPNTENIISVMDQTNEIMLQIHI